MAKRIRGYRCRCWLCQRDEKAKRSGLHGRKRPMNQLRKVLQQLRD